MDARPKLNIHKMSVRHPGYLGKLHLNLNFTIIETNIF